MRRGLLRAVSSALLLLSLASMPHPESVSDSMEDMALGIREPRIVISEFYPCALAGDEYFSISSQGDIDFVLRNWSVTDGEGEMRFIADIWLFSGRSITVSCNATSFWCAYDRMPDVSLDSPGIGDLLVVSGSFRLADSGDSLSLVSPEGDVVDSVIYGSTSDSVTGWTGDHLAALRKGEVAKRITSNGRLVDTDTASDWQPFREFKYGFTEFEPKEFEVKPGDITAFTCPDCSFDVVAAAVDGARNSINICTYEFSSMSICEKLLSALGRGISIRLLVDGAPAGDMNEDEIACLSVLRCAGADVRTVNGNLSRGIAQHIGALHSKYMVIDSTLSCVMSENCVEDGLPQNRVIGNRGWGVMIDDPDLAAYLLDLFDSDSRRSRLDVHDWRDDSRFDSSSALSTVHANASVVPLIGPLISTQRASVTVFVSPDGSLISPYILDYMKASSSVIVEQFQADLYWTSRWTGEMCLNPIVGSLLSSASRGVAEKVLLDSSWFNFERNSQVIDCLAGNSTSDSSEFRLLDSRSPITSLHNKGAVVDRRISAITSNNWVAASFSKNRELAVIIESDEIASHFMKAFEYDFTPDETAPRCDAGPDADLVLGKSVVLDADKCSDDRQIYEYSWDIDSDGVIDSHEERLLFRGDVLGEHIVVLKVTDSWGNSATDEIRVTVTLQSVEDRDRSHEVPNLLWFAPVVVAVGILLARAARARRSARNSRNINHRPRS